MQEDVHWISPLSLGHLAILLVLIFYLLRTHYLEYHKEREDLHA